MTAALAALSTDSLERLIAESSRLRDHLLHVQGQDSVALSGALRPFERAGGIGDVGDAEIAALSREFQDAHDRAHESIDAFTLTEVLKGNSPHRHKGSGRGSILMALIGVLLVLSAYHFTLWSNRTATIVVKAEEFIAFDHFNKIMRLVELQNYFEQESDSNRSPDLEPQLVYLEGITALRDQYTIEQYLPQKMNDTQLRLVPFRANFDRNRRHYCARQAALHNAEQKAASPDASGDVVARNTGLATTALTSEAGDSAQQSLRDILYRCPEPAPVTQAALPAPINATADAAEVSEAVLQDLGYFREGVNTVADLQQETMFNAGRQRLRSYASSRLEVAEKMQELKEMLNIVTLWALPILYGALGSVVYCMSRILNPDLAPLGRIYSVVRTAFAGLAALTFSMLIVPSNALSAGIELNSPLIFLASFIFGYSIEAFVNLLNRLNAYLTSSLTPRNANGG